MALQPWEIPAPSDESILPSVPLMPLANEPVCWTMSASKALILAGSSCEVDLFRRACASIWSPTPGAVAIDIVERVMDRYYSSPSGSDFIQNDRPIRSIAFAQLAKALAKQPECVIRAPRLEVRLFYGALNLVEPSAVLEQMTASGQVG